MSYPKNRSEWITLAKATIPLLPYYAESHGCTFNKEAAELELLGDDFTSLVNRFNQLWGDLPDHPGIRYAPFGALCDLCSECWCVIPEPDNEPDEDPDDLRE